MAHHYDLRLSSIPQLRRPALVLPNRKISWFVYVVRLGEGFSQTQRDWICEEMRGLGIAVGRYFAPIHLQPAYHSSKNMRKLTVTEFEAQRTIALPFFNQIRAEQVDEVSDSLSKLCKAH